MATTTIHIPDDLLMRLDRVVRSQGISRNRFILNACSEALERQAGEWPEGFFDDTLCDEDRAILRQATIELDQDVRSRRVNRGAIAL